MDAEYLIVGSACFDSVQNPSNCISREKYISEVEKCLSACKLNNFYDRAHAEEIKKVLRDLGISSHHPYKKKFYLLNEVLYLRDTRKRVLLKEDMYDAFYEAHREAKHGGQRKTYNKACEEWACVKQRFSDLFVAQMDNCPNQRKTTKPLKRKIPGSESSTNKRSRVSHSTNTNTGSTKPLGSNLQPSSATPSISTFSDRPCSHPGLSSHIDDLTQPNPNIFTTFDLSTLSLNGLIELTSSLFRI